MLVFAYSQLTLDKIEKMYTVGIKNNTWMFISNGVEIYAALKDIRHHSSPPNDNRIKQVHMTWNNFVQFCTENQIRLMGHYTNVEQLKSDTTGGGIFGYFGRSLSKLLGGSSEFKVERLKVLFERVKKEFTKWNSYDLQQQQYKKIKEKEEDELARENWRRYHRLSNINSIDDHDGKEFEHAIALVYEKLGYRVSLTNSTGDFGVDVIAERAYERLAIQTKRYKGTVGVQAIQEVAGGKIYYKATEAIVITNSFFTPQAKKLAEALGVKLINRKRLALLWEKAHPEAQVPPYDRKKYEELKSEIKRVLWNADFSARTNKAKYRR